MKHHIFETKNWTITLGGVLQKVGEVSTRYQSTRNTEHNLAVGFAAVHLSLDWLYPSSIHWIDYIDAVFIVLFQLSCQPRKKCRRGNSRAASLFSRHHGPNTSWRQKCPSIFIATSSSIYKKTIVPCKNWVSDGRPIDGGHLVRLGRWNPSLTWETISIFKL